MSAALSIEALSKAGQETRVSDENNVAEVASGAEVIVLAVPFGAIDDVVRKIGSNANGKVVIDATNALTAAMRLALGQYLLGPHRFPS